MENKNKMMVPEGVCKHCGGIMRYYRGSLSCLMCGREREHECPNCINSDKLKKTA